MSHSVSSFDTSDFIDLDNALIEEELCSLGATPENRDYYNNNYRISFKSVDAKEAERLRTTLITPMTYCSITPRSLLKTPDESVYAESVALFKNLSDNDHIDLVSSNLQDFMDHCDMDDLLSKAATSRPSSSSSAKQPYRHNHDSLTRLSTHNKIQRNNHQESYTLLQKLSEPNQQQMIQNENEGKSSPLGHTENGYTHTLKPTVINNSYKQPTIDSADTNKPQNRTLQSIINKRRSIDSESLSKLRQNSQAKSSSPKRYSMVSVGEHETTLPLLAKSKLPVSRMPVPANKDSRRNSNIQQPAASNTTAARRRNSNLQQPANTNATIKRRNSNLQQPTANNSSLKRRDSSLQSSPALNASVTVKRRSSNLQQPSATKSTIQRRDSSLPQPATSKTTVKRRNSSLQQPAASTNTSLHRRNSSLQHQNEQDRRRWSSYIPEHSQKHIISEDQAPAKEISTPQRTSNIIANQQASCRQEARKLSNRHSMISPASKGLLQENIYEDVQPSSIMSSRNEPLEDDELEPSLPSSAPSLVGLSEKARRRHTISASVRNANLGQLFKQIADKKASMYGANHSHSNAIDENDYQHDVDHQLQKRHTLSSDRRSYMINSSSYERSTEEPNRFRSRLRNLSKDGHDQTSLLKSPVLENSKHHCHGDFEYQIRAARYNDLNAQAEVEEDDDYYHPEVLNAEHRQAEQHIVPPPRYNSRMLAEQRHIQLLAGPAPAPAPAPAPTSITTIAAQRRHRAASMPLHQQRTEEEYSTPEKPSLMAVSGRYRKHSNSSISKYASVPENAGLNSFSPPKDIRHGLSNSHTYPEIQVEASRSSGGLSNSTASSSRSSDKYYDPPTPPANAVVTHQYNKRRSMPVFNASMIDEQVNRAENRYSSYLARVQSVNGSADYQETTPSRRMFPRRQRVVSEDNEYYKHQFDQHRKTQQQIYRDEETEDVISSAKHLLSLVKERRNRAH
ncbi:hypothetical protein [Parasitella parasitica]|uniref:Uncharacterized protein n=1 Tax=Parasitella parasitica TaxID=35722 RepID=A0A0B7NHC2_9FUNG|nr:hypothetical protein [Parasitella parasitica]